MKMDDRPSQPAQALEQQRFHLMTVREVLTRPTSSWRVKGILPEIGIAAIYGPSSSSKTFLALDLTSAIESGRPWFGHKVKAAPVAYLWLEAQGGLNKRVTACLQSYSLSDEKRLRFLTPMDFDLSNPTHANELAEVLLEALGQGCVVVIDTLAQAVPGMDENSSSDMSKVLRACKILQTRLQGLVLLIHHTGKDIAKGMRGHSSLYAAMDVVIEVTRQGDLRSWHITKAKDDEDGAEYLFRLEQVTLGTDEDGDPITSCVVHPIESPTSSIRNARLPKGPNQHTAYDTLKDLLNSSQDYGQGDAPAGRPCIRLNDWINAVKRRLDCDSKHRSDRVKVATNRLISNGVVGHADGWVWLP